MRVRENMSGAGGGSDGSGGTKHSLRLCEHNTTQHNTTQNNVCLGHLQWGELK
jgi:hypothetical protein